MEILNRYVLTKSEFFEFMMKHYAANEYIFDQAPQDEQYRAILRFLGQSYGIVDKLQENALKSVLNDYLSRYENLLIKYPDGMKNELSVINEMSHKERLRKLPELYTPHKVFLGLSMALIDRDFSRDYYMKLNISINQALIDIESETKDDSFLSAENVLSDEEIPF